MIEQVAAQTSIKTVEFDLPLSSDNSMQKVMTENNGSYVAKSWMTVKEPVGIWGENNFTAQGILEHLNVTKDLSDYLWHLTRYIFFLNMTSTRLDSITIRPGKILR